VALIVLKVSAIQVFLHDCEDEGQKNDCELCDHAIHNQNIEFSTPPQPHGFEIDHTPVFCQRESHYKSVCIATPINDIHFGGSSPHTI